MYICLVGSKLKIDSCLCDHCWEQLEKTFNENIKRNEIVSSLKPKRNDKLGTRNIFSTRIKQKKETHPKKNSKNDTTMQYKLRPCSVYKCSNNGVGYFSSNSWALLNCLISRFDFNNVSN